MHSTISVLHEPAVYSIGLWYLLEAGCLNLRVKCIIQMFHFRLVVLSVLVYRHWLLPVVRYWLLPVNSPTAGHIWKHVFPKGSNDRYTVGEFFQYRFLPILFKTRCASKKKHTLKTKVANTKCRLFATILMHPAGLSWFKIMRPLWEACVWDPGRAGKKITVILSKVMKQTIIV